MMEFLTDNLKSYGKFSKVWKLLGLTGQVYPAYHGPHTLTLNIAWFVENSRFAIEERPWPSRATSSGCLPAVRTTGRRRFGRRRAWNGRRGTGRERVFSIPIHS